MKGDLIFLSKIFVYKWRNYLKSMTDDYGTSFFMNLK